MKKQMKNNGVKRVLVMVLILILATLFVGCGYTCSRCDKATMKAYYTSSGDKSRVMCEDCARKYWMPFPYENYRVK